MQHLQILVQIRLIAGRAGGAPEVSERPSTRVTLSSSQRTCSPGMVLLFAHFSYGLKYISPDISMLRPTS